MESTNAFSVIVAMSIVIVIGLSFGLYRMSAPQQDRPPVRPIPGVTWPAIYTAQNVRLDKVYAIMIRHRESDEYVLHQQFQVLDRRREHLFIKVSHRGGMSVNQGRAAFKGWTTKIPADRLIRPSDLSAECPA